MSRFAEAYNMFRHQFLKAAKLKMQVQDTTLMSIEDALQEAINDHEFKCGGETPMSARWRDASNAHAQYSKVNSPAPTQKEHVVKVMKVDMWLDQKQIVELQAQAIETCAALIAEQVSPHDAMDETEETQYEVLSRVAANLMQTAAKLRAGEPLI